MSDAVETRIVAYLAETLSANGAAQHVDRDTPLLDTGLLDSMGLAGLIAFVEQTFEVPLADEALTTDLFETPAILAAYVGGRLAAAPVTHR